MDPITIGIGVGTAAVSALGSVLGHKSEKKQAERARDISMYNAIMGYNMGIDNLGVRKNFSDLNFQLAAQSAVINSKIINYAANYNIDIIRKTTLYNNSLLDEQLDLIWESVDLDIAQVENQRKRERGEILAWQSASGTVMDEGSNKEFVIAQKTQEVLDVTIIEHNADVAARDIANAKARNSWEGAVQIAKTQYEGQLSSFQSYYNSMAQAVSGYGSNLLAIGSDYRTNAAQFGSSMVGGEYQYNADMQASNTKLVNGMFSAVGRGISAYSAAGGTFGGGGGSTLATGNVTHGASIMRQASGSYSGYSGYAPLAGLN